MPVERTLMVTAHDCVMDATGCSVLLQSELGDLYEVRCPFTRVLPGV